MPGKTVRFLAERWKGQKMTEKEQRFQRDMDRIAEDPSIEWEKLRGKTVLITGATGLIGKFLVRALVYKSRKDSLGIKILALTRSREKAEKMFAGEREVCADPKFLVGNVEDLPAVEGDVDFVIHGASQTSSRAFVNEPVETIRTAVCGTANVLQLAEEKKVSGFVYLSSMEVYGAPQTDEKITEDRGTDLDTMAVRSSYPESKRMCECLCSSYCEEYGVPAKILRLTQTFGPGVSYEDTRVFAEFARCALEQKDIVLHTRGGTKRSYLDVTDAVRAILIVLLRGKEKEAYNAANEESYCSIYEMAVMVAENFGKQKIRVRCEVTENIQGFGYAPELHMNLDTKKLQELGWRPGVSLKDTFERMIWEMEQKE